MKKYVFVVVLVLYTPFLFAQKDTIFVWDNDRGKSAQVNPSVGFFGSGRGFAAWDDGRWGDYDIFGQEYDLERGLQGTNFMISTDTYNRFQQYQSDISCNPKNTYIATWVDSMYNPQRPGIILARLHGNGNEPFKVWEEGEKNKYPSVSSRREGWFAISWTCYVGPPEPIIFCKFYDEQGQEQNFNTVCEGVKTSYIPKSNVALCDTGGLVVYEDYEGDGTEISIYGQYTRRDGGIFIDRFKVSYYAGGSEKNEQRPDVATNEKGDMIIAWMDDQYSGYKIVVQRGKAHDGDFEFIGAPELVNQDAGDQRNPRVAISANAGVSFAPFIVVWEEKDGSGEWDVWGRVYDRNGWRTPFRIPAQNDSVQMFPYATSRWNDLLSIVWASWLYHPKMPDVFLRNFQFDAEYSIGVVPLSSDIPLVPVNPDTGVGGRKCWYFDDENYDNPATPLWNEDPIPEGSPEYVDLEYAIVDQLMELNTNNQYVIDCEDTLPFRQGDERALSDYDAIFLDLGYRTSMSTAGTITQTERNAMVTFVKDIAGTGGPLMVDGNDFGYMYDTTELFSMFRAAYFSDGANYTTGNIENLYGYYYAKDMELPYPYQDLVDNYPDIVRPTNGGRRILESDSSIADWYASYSIGFSMSWFDGEQTQNETHLNSFIPAAITGTTHPNTYAEFYRRCLGHLKLAVQPEPIVDLTADTLDTTGARVSEGEVCIVWSIVCDDSLNDPVNDGYKLKFSRSKMESEAEYDAGEEYYQTWTTSGNVDDTVSQTLYGLPPLDTLIFALKCHDEDDLYNALGAEPRSKVMGDSVTPHNLVIGKNYVKDFSNKYEFLHAHPLGSQDDSLFVTWDSDTFYIGFARFSFQSSGDMLIYIDYANGQGADSTYPLNGSTWLSRFNAQIGEFRPEYCIVLNHATSLGMYRCTGKGGRDSWLPVINGINYCVDNVVNGYEYTEIGIPFSDLTGYSTSNPFKLVVTVQNESNNIIQRIYPPFNPYGGGSVTITQYYYWTRLASGMVPKYTAQIIGIEEEETYTPDFESLGKLLHAVPNPFSRTVDVFFKSSEVVTADRSFLHIYDVSGRMVKSYSLITVIQQGESKVTWDGRDENGRDMASGIYFCELKTPDRSAVEKLIIVR